jgi:hypothetical protein
MSDFSCPLVRIGEIKKHSNADTLSITEVEGCPVIIRTTDFREGDLAVYLPVESMIPEGLAWVKEHCSHLKFKNGFHRLRAARFRGVFSMGMLVPSAALFESPVWRTCHLESNLGKDVAGELGVGKYEEPEDQEPQQAEPEPRTAWQRIRAWFRRLFRKKPPAQKPRLMPVYEVGHYRKLKTLLVPGEVVVCTEKIHGCNGAFCFKDGQLYVSSHRVLRKVEDESIWWQVARQYKLAEKLAKHPNHAFYGEVFGHGVQDMEYGRPQGSIELRFFDIMNLETKDFLGYDAARAVLKDLDLVPVPELYRGPYDPAVIEPMADGKSTVGGTYREGFVIRPTAPGRRIVLKLVGETYLLRKGGTEKH